MARKKKEVQVEDPFNYGGLISFLCVFILIFFSISKTGPVGLFINNLFSYLFGPYYLTLLITLFVCAFIKVFLSHKYKFNVWFYIGITILNIAVMLLGTVLFYGVNSTFLGSTKTSFKSFGLLLNKKEVMMVFIHTDLPEPVAPATSK